MALPKSRVLSVVSDILDMHEYPKFLICDGCQCQMSMSKTQMQNRCYFQAVKKYHYFDKIRDI